MPSQAHRKPPAFRRCHAYRPSYASGPRAAERLVAEFAAAAGHEVVQLGADGVVQRGRFERFQLLAPDLAGPGGGVLAALLEPALEVRGGGEPRALEAVAGAF